MSLVLASIKATVAPTRTEPCFQVCRSQTGPTYHRLSLEDAQGCLVRWVIPLPIKYLAKRPVLLWLLPAASPAGTLTCLDTGSMQLAPVHPGTPIDLRADLAEGLLRLNFNGQLLRGYFRLECLPESSRQLWQLTPIGCV